MLSQDEAELYDRQIRLWGLNAQSKIRKSKVLMLGFDGVASEIAKILTLAGINTLTIIDDKELQQSDLTSNIFCRPNNPSSENKNSYRTNAVIEKLHKLNPLVKVNVINSPMSNLKPEDYDGFDLVTLNSFSTIDEITNINNICRDKKIKFYFAVDYGFYGFMFNDLGPEFKFTYEVFDAVKSTTSDTTTLTGHEKDPIAIVDDVQDGGDEEDHLNSESDDDRPKKKRRLHSPKRDTEVKSNNEKTTKMGSLTYVPFQNMISIQSHDITNRTSPVLFLSIALLKFYSEKKQRPENTKEHLSRVKEIFDATIKHFNAEKPLTRLHQEWYDLIHSNYSPISSVLGGVAGQDMIRALSNKDIPLHNTFSLDGSLDISGIVEKVGISTPKESQSKPIVRDFIELDLE